MKRLLCIVTVIVGVVVLSLSTSPAEDGFLKGKTQGDIPFLSGGAAEPKGIPNGPWLFLELPFGTYRLEGSFQLDQKKISPIDVGKEKENIFSVQFSIRW